MNRNQRARHFEFLGLVLLCMVGLSASDVSRSTGVQVSASKAGPMTIRTSTAEFEIMPSGYVRAFLRADGKRLTLDEPQGGALGEGSLTMAGRELSDFNLDLASATVTDVRGELGESGKRIEIAGKSRAAGGVAIEKTLTVEVYDNFPNLAFSTVAYKNAGSSPVKLDRVVTGRHRFNASLADASVPPYRLWSFQGSSYEWGKDDVMQISKDFSQPNVMGKPTPHGAGGGIPVVAFWTASVGEAIGHVETLPLVLSIPVKVQADGRIRTFIELEPETTLQPGEVYRTPRTFVAVYSGDFYQPLRLWSQVLGREGWKLPKPNPEDYQMSWCGWGYEFNVTPAQMLGTIPKLKELHIHWATLDDRWFDIYGDWNPRHDTFPGDAIQKMVEDFHRQGIKVQLWWLPLGVEDGQGKYESHRYEVSDVVRKHPDWLILDRNGEHARMIRDLAAFCPALPEVQEYYKQLTVKFIREWGFDGHKLDNIYTVPACYNPKHHHKSPLDSTYAMGEVYKTIYETTRALKPDSVTQSCPCGTPPSLAWLPYMDQAVTADPVGSVQVRRRIKMYKALLGPEAAVYGDHVELTEIKYQKGEEIDLGEDFASTVGVGGVVGTKFVWPDPGPHFKTVFLTPAKETVWKKWTDIYNAQMLSQGTFLDLYKYGYDVPEGYAIAKDGKMYYAFFAPEPLKPWTGEVELRGLNPGKYRIYDYEHNKDLGTLDGSHPRLKAEFTHHLLLEATKE